MKNGIVEVIVYLLETVASPATAADDQVILKQRLEDAGFAKETVSSAFDWLKELIEQQCWYATSTTNFGLDTEDHKTLRIFSSEEAARISLEVRNFILSLEYAGVLDTKMREIVISQLLQLHQKSVDLFDAKWVVLLVLMSKLNKNAQDMRSYLLTTMALESA